MSDLSIDCPNCGKHVDAKVCGSYDLGYSDGSRSLFTLLRCPSCDHPVLTSEKEDSLGWSKPVILHPPSEVGIDPNIPSAVRKSYREARACFNARAFDASAIMCRKTLEGICVEHGIKARNLDSSLREMKATGLIDGRLVEWAEALRIVGNEAAHDVRSDLTIQDVQDLLDFTKALLEYMFTFRDRFEQFNARRKQSRA